MLYQIPQPTRRVDEGATKQPTSPIPPVTTRPDAWYGYGSSSFRNVNIWSAGPRAQVDQGATKQQTHPVPPVTTRPDAWYGSLSDVWRDVNRRLMGLAGPRPQIDQGATVTGDSPGAGQKIRLFYRVLRQGGPGTPIEGVPVIVPMAPIPPVTVTPDGWFGSSSAAFRNVNLRLSGPRAQVDQGATVTGDAPGADQMVTLVYRVLRQGGPITPIEGVTVAAPQLYQFPLSQPVFRYYVPDINRLLEDNGPQEQYEGATVQATHPTPGVTTRPDGWFGWTSVAFDDVLRRVTGPRPQVDQGATVQPTDPIPPVGQPELIGWLTRELARRYGGPVAQMEGATKQQLFQFVLNQPDLSRYLALQGPRFQVSVVPRLEQVTVVAVTDVYPPLLPPTRSLVDVNRLVWMPPRVEGATVQPTFPVPPVGQPELIGWLARELARKLGGPVAQFDGPTIQQTYEFFPSQPELRHWNPVDINRYPLLGAPARVEGATIQQLFQFFPGQPELSRFALLQGQRFQVPTVPRFEGATIQQLFQFFPSQPELRRWLLFDPNRAPQLGPQAQTTGPTTQDTVPVPPVSGPEFIAWSRRELARLLGGPIAQVHQGATVQDILLVPPVSGPELIGWTALQRTRFLGGPASQVAGVTVQDWFLYPPNQPDLTRYDLPRQAWRWLVTPPLRAEGATVQQTFEFVPNQPELRRWTLFDPNRSPRLGPFPQLEGAVVVGAQTYVFYPDQPASGFYGLVGQQVRYRQDVKVQIDQGATRQQTFPVPPVTARPDPWFGHTSTAFRDVNVRLSGAGPRPQVDQGATKQQTHPVPPVTTRPDVWFVPPFGLRYDVTLRLVGPKAQVDRGATIQPTDPIPPVSEPELIAFLRRELARLLGGPIPQMDQGATRQQTHPVPPVTGRPDAWFGVTSTVFRDVNVRLTGPKAQVEGATRQDTIPTPPVSEPELIAWLRREYARMLGGPIAQLEGPTIQQTHPILFVAQPLLLVPPRQKPVIWMPLEQAIVPQVYEFTPNQPEAIRYALKDLARRLGGPTPQVTGPTIQATFIFPPNQPELVAWARRELARLLGGPMAQTEGPVTQQTFPVPPVSEPELIRWLQREFARTQGGPRAQVDQGPTRQQTYEFVPNQPEWRRFALRDLARSLGGPIPQPYQGATVQQLYQFFPNQPELIRWLAREVVRGLGGTTFVFPIGIVPPRVLHMRHEHVREPMLANEAVVLITLSSGETIMVTGLLEDFVEAAGLDTEALGDTDVDDEDVE